MKKFLKNVFKGKKLPLKELIKKNKKEYGLTADLIERFDPLIEDFKNSQAMEKFSERVNSVENVEIYFKSDGSIERFKKKIRKDYLNQIKLGLVYLEERLSAVYAEKYSEEKEFLSLSNQKVLKESSKISASLKMEEEEYLIERINKKNL